MRLLLSLSLTAVLAPGAFADWLPESAAAELVEQAQRGAAGQQRPAVVNRADALAVMTYNLRYASYDETNPWPDRRPVMKKLLRSYSPDVMGTQEGTWEQVREIAKDLPGYAWIGKGAEDGEGAGEYLSVYYKTARLTALDSGHFWLSGTPDVVGSTTWGNSNIRMVTWVRFQDRRTGRRFEVWNTHLDHEIQLAREKSAALILARIGRVPPEMPVILIGDFNGVAGENPAYDALAGRGGLSDAWTAARTRTNPDANTFNGFGPLLHEGKRIDWILTRGPFVAHAAENVTYRQGEQWPSDHLPVVASLELR